MQPQATVIGLIFIPRIMGRRKILAGAGSCRKAVSRSTRLEYWKNSLPVLEAMMKRVRPPGAGSIARQQDAAVRRPQAARKCDPHMLAGVGLPDRGEKGYRPSSRGPRVEFRLQPNLYTIPAD